MVELVEREPHDLITPDANLAQSWMFVFVFMFSAVGLSLADHKSNGNEPLKCISESCGEERNPSPSLSATKTESTIVSQ